METPNEDQRPDGWSQGAASYEELFAPFTGAYADDAIRLLSVTEHDRIPDGAQPATAAAFAAEVAASGGDRITTTALIGTGIAP